MKLSEHFTLAELTRSVKALELGIPNVPTVAGVETATLLCERVLEPLRARWGAVKVNSGFRCHALNSAVGGAATSDHVWDEFGASVDCAFPEASSLEAVFDWLRLESGLPFDQVILERGREERHERDDCIHISWRPNPRRQAKRGETNGRGKYVAVEVV